MEKSCSLKKIELTLKSDKNNSFNINFFINYSSLLNIKITSINISNEKTFYNSFSFDYIINKNKYFLMCNNIFDILVLIDNILRNKDNIKLLENINEFIIQLNVPNPFSPQMEFILKENKDINSIDELLELVKNQDNEIVFLRNAFEEQQKLIEKLENKIKLLEEKININTIQKNLDVSKIIVKENELKLKEWINPNENISFNLLYRKGENQFKASDFHKYCDNRGPTLVLIETTKGYKFGGYTSLDWESPSNTLYKTDENTFLFSLNPMKKYQKFKNGRSIYVDKSYGPGFGEGCDLLLGYPHSNEGEGTNSNYLKNHELTNGEKSFILKEVEIFQVIFN